MSCTGNYKKDLEVYNKEKENLLHLKREWVKLKESGEYTLNIDSPAQLTNVIKKGKAK